MSTVTIETYWTVKEIAERARVKENTVRRWLMNKELKPTKLGGATRIKESDFLEFERRSNAA